jgi:hypothetical protein
LDSGLAKAEAGRLSLDNTSPSTTSNLLLSQGMGFNMKQSAPALMKDCSISFAEAATQRGLVVA